ncbi:glycosyltransferase [Methanolobus sediminis]|uniref:Glycosyltransferase n=1 Tax=Methanolobus sediminis TaxID=3072978 RepID=A0AA51ULV1_9EURY|nr:glycosyltransferase [Methanolobus sediminis]WMW24380.1 glycosyltransferase [Methanolobus sediminis]
MVESQNQLVDIVFFSDIFWDALWQRHHHLLTRFPSDWRILFIEPTSIPVLLKEPRRLFVRQENNITIVSLPLIPIIDRIGRLRQINDFFILTWLRVVLKKRKFICSVLFYCEPRFSSLIGKLNEKMVAFDYIDDKLAFSNVPKWMNSYLNRLIDQSDVVFASSTRLYRSVFEYKNSDVFLITNGVDVDHFQKTFEELPVPEDIKKIRKPIIGYIGAIADWVDFDIIAKISKEHPNMSILMVGPQLPNVKSDIDYLKKLPNVYFLGKKPYELLPNYLRHFDICIIPFKVNNLTLSSNPIKFYEYLSAGKKVISVDLPEIKAFENYAYIAKNSSEFIKLIPLIMDKENNIETSLQTMEECTWERKTKTMVDLIVKKLAELNHN